MFDMKKNPSFSCMSLKSEVLLDVIVRPLTRKIFWKAFHFKDIPYRGGKSKAPNKLFCLLITEE
jgi:hypothetical protein